MTWFEIVALVAGGTFLYMIMVGISHHVVFKCSNLNWDDSLVASMFLWYLILPAVAARRLCTTIPEKIMEYRNKRVAKSEKKKELPPIYVKEGAKIETMATYKQLKQLCTDFEVEFEANQEVNKVLES